MSANRPGSRVSLVAISFLLAAGGVTLAEDAALREISLSGTPGVSKIVLGDLTPAGSGKSAGEATLRLATGEEVALTVTCKRSAKSGRASYKLASLKGREPKVGVRLTTMDAEAVSFRLKLKASVKDLAHATLVSPTEIGLDGCPPMVGLELAEASGTLDVGDSVACVVKTKVKKETVKHSLKPSPGAAKVKGRVQLNGTPAALAKLKITLLVSVDGTAGVELTYSGAMLNHWEKILELTADDAARDRNFGWRIAVSGDVAIFGSIYDHSAGTDAGSAYLFDVAIGEQRAKLLPDDLAANSSFGCSVGIRGNTVIVGASGQDGTGAAYLFDATTGELLRKLTATDGAADDRFGGSVAISDGAAIVGAPRDADGGHWSGSAYLFDTTTGEQTAKLTAADAAMSDQFGYVVGIDGAFALVAAPRSPGTSVVYQFEVSTGTLLRKLSTGDPACNGLGAAIAMSGDRALVTGPAEVVAGADSAAGWVFDLQTGEALQRLWVGSEPGDGFGLSAALDGSLAVAGGGAAAFVFDSGSGRLLGKVIHRDPIEYDSINFGASVAVAKDLLLVGAPSADGGVDRSGSVMIFRGTAVAVDEPWVPEARLWPDDESGRGVRLGSSAAVSGDVAVFGALGADVRGEDSGAAFVFRRSGGSWNREARLLAADGASHDAFGYSVDVDGDVVVVGAYDDDDNGSSAGTAFVFRWDGGEWVQEAKLLPSDGMAYALFGRSVAVSGDRVAVGASNLKRPVQYEPKTGAVYVFRREGEAWVQEAQLLAGNGASGDDFGQDVDLDGDRIVVGAPGRVINSYTQGTAYVYRREGLGWIEEDEIRPAETTRNLGWGVAISGDEVLLGARYGVAYAFRRSGLSWVFEARLEPEDAAPDDSFSWSVALEGDLAVLGGPDVDDRGERAGGARVFRRTGGVWKEEARLLPEWPSPGDFSGWSVAVTGGRILMAAVNSDSDTAGANCGSAYVFEPR